MDWRNIPSLSALRAFESAARLTSFSAAARELNVTHAAIAQHVRALENELEHSLIFRQGRKMALTDAGRRLSLSLSDGFSTIETGVEDIRTAGKTRPLSISVTPSFAENWLMPRLGEFWANHPEITLNIIPTTKLTDLRADNVDIAIRYGDGDWPDAHTARLTSASYVVVASPSLVGNKKIRSLDDLNDMTWLVENIHGEQNAWANKIGFVLSKEKATNFATGSLVVSAARAGLGVAVVVRALIERDLKDRSLVVLYEAEIQDLAYYVLTKSKTPFPKLATFIHWLHKCS